MTKKLNLNFENDDCDLVPSNNNYIEMKSAKLDAEKISYYTFMKNHQSQSEYTHTSYIGGKWLIKDDELEAFYKLYAKELEEKQIPLCITEKHRPKYSPIIIDFDIKYENEIESHITDKIINNIIKHITDIIKKSFDEKEDFLCLVSKRKTIYKDQKSGKYKDGIHIMFPYIVTAYDYQYALRLEYLKIIEDDIKDIPFYIDDSLKENKKYLDNIYDESVIERNNWFLYYSTKPNTAPYMIYKVYNSKLNLTSINKMSYYEQIELMSIRNKDRISMIGKDYYEMMMIYYNNIKFTDLPKTNKKYEPNKGIIKQLLDILAPFRYQLYADWIKIGYILHNTSDDYLDLWIEWSNKSEKHHNDGGCEKYWKLMKNPDKHLSLGSLYYFAEKDNKEEYDKIIKLVKKNKNKNEAFDKEIVNHLEKGERDMAKYYSNEFKNDIVFTINNIYIWYDILKIWIRCQINDISCHLADFINGSLSNIIRKELDDNNTNKVVELSKLLKKSTNYSFIDRVLKYVKSDLTNITFDDKLDACRHVINFKNGLYDLKIGKFRNRNKEDYISKCLDYDYSDQVNIDIKNKIRQTLSQISNDDDELLEFNLNWLGYCLTGETKEQKFLTVIGYTAQNGKSTMAKMFMNSLPIYSEKIDKRTFNLNYQKAHKQFSKLKQPIRFVYIEELDRSQLDVDRLKDFVDGDKIGGNEVLYGTTEDINLHCKIYCTSNKDPIFESDEGFRRRGLLEILTNKFLEKTDYDKVKNKKEFI